MRELVAFEPCFEEEVAQRPVQEVRKADLIECRKRDLDFSKVRV